MSESIERWRGLLAEAQKELSEMLISASDDLRKQAENPPGRWRCSTLVDNVHDWARMIIHHIGAVHSCHSVLTALGHQPQEKSEEEGKA